MPSKERKLSLSAYDDLFQTEDAHSDDAREQVIDIPLEELHPFRQHPFQVRDDEAMKSTVESIMKYGVLTPGIARPLADGEYEIISGHRRKRACELAGLATMPFIIRSMDDDAATILMCDSNLQRETILPSERAFAYKMKLEAIKHQGFRSDFTSSHVGMRLQALDLIGKDAGESRNQVHRFIRLTELIPELLQMADDRKIAFIPCVELSYLASDEQAALYDYMVTHGVVPSLPQAQQLKKLSQEHSLDAEAMAAVMSQNSKTAKKITLSCKTLEKYFPDSYTAQQMQDAIISLLERWYRNSEQDMQG